MKRKAAATKKTGNGSSGPRNSWQKLARPSEILIWVLIVAAVVDIYHGAEYLVAHVFNVLLLFVFAAVIALILTPLIDWLEDKPPLRGHRWFWVLTLYLAGTTAIVVLVVLVSPTLIAQGKELPALALRFQHELQKLGISLDLGNAVSGGGTGLHAAVGVVSGVISGVVDFVLVVVISVYLLIEGRGLVATARNLFPSQQRVFDFTALAVGATLASYVRGQAIMSAVIGAYTAAALTLIGVHYGIVIGIAAFFLEFIPLVGAVAVMGLSIAVALTQSPTLALETAAVGLGGHAIDAYVLGPRVAGRVTQLHPLVAMAALLIGAELGGVLGALFSVPIAAIANIMLGAVYRSRRGDEAMSTDKHGEVAAENLPRLGDEIGATEEDGVETKPVPRSRS